MKGFCNLAVNRCSNAPRHSKVAFSANQKEIKVGKSVLTYLLKIFSREKKTMSAHCTRNNSLKEKSNDQEFHTRVQACEGKERMFSSH